MRNGGKRRDEKDEISEGQTRGTIEQGCLVLPKERKGNKGHGNMQHLRDNPG
jgi:hypothetical protein